MAEVDCRNRFPGKGPGRGHAGEQGIIEWKGGDRRQHSKLWSGMGLIAGSTVKYRVEGGADQRSFTHFYDVIFKRLFDFKKV